MRFNSSNVGIFINENKNSKSVSYIVTICFTDKLLYVVLILSIYFRLYSICFFFFSNSAGSRNSKASLDVDGGRLTTNAPTSAAATVNQLARWFSPDLLERARGGELPSTAGLSQHVLSLEEIERQTAPPVHN